jgi:succinate dehydrogenase / fumarate reductase flavoprotein subunit
MNQALDNASRTADFLEFAELLAHDALDRRESCGAHFREEFQEEGECKRNDAEYAYVAAWGYQGDGRPPALHREPLTFEEVHLATRSYK